MTGPGPDQRALDSARARGPYAVEHIENLAALIAAQGCDRGAGAGEHDLVEVRWMLVLSGVPVFGQHIARDNFYAVASGVNGFIVWHKPTIARPFRSAIFWVREGISRSNRH